MPSGRRAVGSVDAVVDEALAEATPPYDPVEAAGSADRARPAQLSWWLFTVAALVFLMVVVGGATRLTQSGLSMTTWEPVSGAVPPLTESAWQTEFDNYRATPEYRIINNRMTLSEFKGIFWWEFTHRLLGRIIGLALIVPFVWFLFRRAIPPGYGGRIALLIALVGLQGAIGWWMVASGLSLRTDVSHYRLATHLLTALFIFGGLIWTALDLKTLAANSVSRPARLTGFGVSVLAILAVQLLFGAYTAGLNAGLVTDEWPLMNGQFFPGATQSGRSLFDAIFNDPAIVHFVHRWWAWVTVGALVLLARRARTAGGRRASVAIHSTFGTQILLGIATVMTGVSLPVAVLHQAVGALVVAATVWGVHVTGKTQESTS